jgi:hypothetical protein
MGFFGQGVWCGFHAGERPAAERHICLWWVGTTIVECAVPIITRIDTFPFPINCMSKLCKPMGKVTAFVTPIFAEVADVYDK